MKRLLVVLTLVTVALVMGSCEKYEDGRPANSVLDKFESMYPKAKDIEWEREGYYWKVSFETGSGSSRKDREAWYDREGNWLRTETDMWWSSVPQEIVDFFEQSEYGSAVVEDNEVDYVQTPEGNYYKFDIIFGGVELAIKVGEDGSVGIAGIER